MAVLTLHCNRRRFDHAPIQIGVRSGTLVRAQRRSFVALFLCPSFIYGGLFRGAKARRSRTGSSNPVQSATLALERSVAVFKSLYEGIPMSKSILPDDIQSTLTELIGNASYTYDFLNVKIPDRDASHHFHDRNRQTAKESVSNILEKLNALLLAGGGNEP